MGKLILLSILLSMIYSWEEIKKTLYVLARARFAKHIPKHYLEHHADQIVSTAVLLFAIPFTLSFHLVSSQNLLSSMLWIILELGAINLITRGLVRATRKLSHGRLYDEQYKFITAGSAVLGFVSPTWNALSALPSLEKKALTKFTLSLSYPLLVGIGLKFLVNSVGADFPIMEKLNALIVIAVIGLFLEVITSSLSAHLHRNKISLTSFARILLGIVIISVLVF
jgi:hypothetical protein